jgi:hypothetical protein
MLLRKTGIATRICLSYKDDPNIAVINLDVNNVLNQIMR